MTLDVDGSLGEGGGQILRTCLACSLVLSRGFRLRNIRAARRIPGLGHQHLVAVEAAARLTDAEVSGASLHSPELRFRPRRPVLPGSYRFDIGTAGSTTLVAQTLLPALAIAPGPTRLVLEGGTHNPMAPPFEFLQRSFLPLLGRLGPGVAAVLERPGFYPAGGGLIRLEVVPSRGLAPLVLTERGPVGLSAVALLSRLPEHIAQRELAVVRRELGVDSERLAVERAAHARGPGSLLLVHAESEAVTEVFTGFGKPGLPAETVAAGVVAEVRRYLDAGVPVGPYLADQLLILLALAGGEIRTVRPSSHTLTNLRVLRRFLGVDFAVGEVGPDRWRIALEGAGVVGAGGGATA